MGKQVFKVYAQVKLDIEAKNKAELLEILENMNYSFTDEENRIIDTEIQEWTDSEDNPIEED